MTADAVIDAPSPNFDTRGEGVGIEMLVLHYTGMESGDAALQRLRDPAAKVSAHYVVEEDGRIFQLVAEEMRAWHAGVSYWRGRRDINARSIGIEIVNPGHEFGYRPYPPAQMAAVLRLAKEIVARHAIPARNVVGHSDVAPQRKDDPGELFDWRMLAAAGVGISANVGGIALSGEAAARISLARGSCGASVRMLQEALAEIGYEVTIDGDYDAAFENVVRAFQRHWRPMIVDGSADAETQNLVYAVLANVHRLT